MQCDPSWSESRRGEAEPLYAAGRRVAREEADADAEDQEREQALGDSLAPDRVRRHGALERRGELVAHVVDRGADRTVLLLRLALLRGAGRDRRVVGGVQLRDGLLGAVTRLVAGE